MDEVSDESPWLPAILAIDLGDRFLQDGFRSLSVLYLVIPCYLVFGSWLDLFLVAAAAGLKSAATVTSWIRDSASVQVLLTSAFVLLTGRLIFQLVRSRLKSKHDTSWKGPARPYLIPCRTTHSRQIPKKHSFSYSYLVVGTPVGCSGNVNGVVSVDVQKHGGIQQPGSWKQKAWFDVDAAD